MGIAPPEMGFDGQELHRLLGGEGFVFETERDEGPPRAVRPEVPPCHRLGVGIEGRDGIFACLGGLPEEEVIGRALVERGESVEGGRKVAGQLPLPCLDGAFQKSRQHAFLNRRRKPGEPRDGGFQHRAGGLQIALLNRMNRFEKGLVGPVVVARLKQSGGALGQRFLPKVDEPQRELERRNPQGMGRRQRVGFQRGKKRQALHRHPVSEMKLREVDYRPGMGDGVIPFGRGHGLHQRAAFVEEWPRFARGEVEHGRIKRHRRVAKLGNEPVAGMRRPLGQASPGQPDQQGEGPEDGPGYPALTGQGSLQTIHVNTCVILAKTA